MSSSCHWRAGECVHISAHYTHTHARTQTHTHTHARKHTHTHARTHTRTHARTHKHTHTHPLGTHFHKDPRGMQRTHDCARSQEKKKERGGGGGGMERELVGRGGGTERERERERERELVGGCGGSLTADTLSVRFSVVIPLLSPSFPAHLNPPVSGNNPAC